ncbi:hypothetical protein E4U19_004480 [Claviceps sp. Clav32 group G5]|nr:hypothetical protein E4U19_004480 [Claviceps sp. Clav32 group G5]
METTSLDSDTEGFSSLDSDAESFSSDTDIEGFSSLDSDAESFSSDSDIEGFSSLDFDTGRVDRYIRIDPLISQMVMYLLRVFVTTPESGTNSPPEK